MTNLMVSDPKGGFIGRALTRAFHRCVGRGCGMVVKKSWGLHSKHTVRHGSWRWTTARVSMFILWQCRGQCGVVTLWVIIEIDPATLVNTADAKTNKWRAVDPIGGIATIKRDDYSSGTRFQCLSRVAAALCLSGHRPEVLRPGCKGRCQRT